MRHRNDHFVLTHVAEASAAERRLTVDDLDPLDRGRRATAWPFLGECTANEQSWEQKGHMRPSQDVVGIHRVISVRGAIGTRAQDLRGF
jgi:hypothetical protein